MKILGTIFYSVLITIASLTGLISLCSALSKFSVFSKTSVLQAFGYITYYWIFILFSTVFILFILLRRWRAALIYFAVMVVFTILLFDYSFSFLTNRNPKDRYMYDSLNVVALNVKYYSKGIENVGRFIRENDFDVVLLSESVLTPAKLEFIKTKLPEYTLVTDGGHDLSLLTKYPIVYYKIIEFPTYQASPSKGNDIDEIEKSGVHRSFIHALLDIKGTYVNVLSLRLIAGRAKNNSIRENIRWGKYLVNSQNKELMVFLDYINSLSGPVIFGGDLNVPPNSPTIKRIRQYNDDSYLDKHFMGSFTFSSGFPRMRLDYIFHSRDILTENSEIVRAKISDHMAVSSKLWLKKTPVKPFQQLYLPD